MTQHDTTVMVVDQDAALQECVREISARRGYSPLLPSDADEALRSFERRSPSAVVLDLQAASGRGLETLASFKRIDRQVPVVVVSGAGQPSMVIQAFRSGAADFLCKPVGESELESALHRALVERELSVSLAALRTELETASPYRLVGEEGGQVAGLRRLLARVAETDVPVLLRGERGTGKERLARALHAASPRKHGPFVKVNCALDAEQLLEASLFGYERGSMGGAVSQKPGRLEFANHGTIYLEEVSSLGAGSQARLLHALREGSFRRHGGQEPVSVDARVTAATSDDLQRAVAEARFREDLLFRLNVLDITIPPLRDRPGDIPALTDHFLARFSVQYNKPRPRLSPETLALFREHVWPGNVAELESAVMRLVVSGNEAQLRRDLQRARHDWMSAAGVLRRQAADFQAAEAGGDGNGDGPAARGLGSLKEIARTAAREAERAAITQMLQRTRWNRKEAAEILGISYKALLYKIKENGLDKPSSGS